MSENQYPLSTGRSNILGTEAFRNLLGQSLNNAKEEIIILSAFVKIKGINWLVDKISREKINCTIISKWDRSDIAQSASDLECYEICKKEGWQFKVLKNLHAKIMLIDKKELFIGSPNLTAKGMSLTPVPNKEMGVKLKLLPTAWDGIIAALVTGKCDIIMSGMTITQQRNLKINSNLNRPT